MLCKQFYKLHLADGNTWTYTISSVYNKVITCNPCRRQLRKKLLPFQNLTCNPASKYSNSFTLVQQPQVNKITLKLGKLLLSMRTRQYVPPAWSFSLPNTY